jgi:hypothetical protein
MLHTVNSFQGYFVVVTQCSERFNSRANYPMLAQTTARDIYARGVRSQAATGSDPQTSFALAHVTTRP